MGDDSVVCHCEKWHAIIAVVRSFYFDIYMTWDAWMVFGFVTFINHLLKFHQQKITVINKFRLSWNAGRQLGLHWSWTGGGYVSFSGCLKRNYGILIDLCCMSFLSADKNGNEKFLCRKFVKCLSNWSPSARVLYSFRSDTYCRVWTYGTLLFYCNIGRYVLADFLALFPNGKYWGDKFITKNLLLCQYNIYFEHVVFYNRHTRIFVSYAVVLLVGVIFWILLYF